MSEQLPGDLPSYVSPHQREVQLDLDAGQREEPSTLSGSEIRDRNDHIDGAKDALVVADDLIAGYIPGVNILNGSDLYAKSGELVGIIGPNGAGKSTLLKAMFGLVKVRTGRVTLARPGHHERPRRPAGQPRHRLRSADQQRLPVADDPGEPGDGVLPGTQALPGAIRLRHRPVPRARGATGSAGRPAVRRRAPDGRHGPRPDDGPLGPPARRAVGRPVPRPDRRGLRAGQGDQRDRRHRDHGRAERHALPADRATADTSSTRAATRTQEPAATWRPTRRSFSSTSARSPRPERRRSSRFDRRRHTPLHFDRSRRSPSSGATAAVERRAARAIPDMTVGAVPKDDPHSVRTTVSQPSSGRCPA